MPKTQAAKYQNFKSLDKTCQRLLLEAKKAMKNGYNPYTNSLVGAAVLTSDGKIISAANVVPRSKPIDICAERATIAKANSYGKRKFKMIAIYGKSGRAKHKDHMFIPCGPCREEILEFAQLSNIDTKVIVTNLSMTKTMVVPISKLMPFALR